MSELAIVKDYLKEKATLIKVVNIRTCFSKSDKLRNYYIIRGVSKNTSIKERKVNNIKVIGNFKGLIYVKVEAKI